MNYNSKYLLERCFCVQNCKFELYYNSIRKKKEGVYSIERDKIKNSLLNFLSEVQSNDMEVLKVGLETYAGENLDFVDCILMI